MRRRLKIPRAPLATATDTAGAAHKTPSRGLTTPNTDHNHG